MSETLLAVLLTGFLGIGGTIAGYMLSAKQASKTFEHQVNLEQLRRKWQIDDEQRAYALSVKARRCDQVEQFIAAMSDDFHQFRTNSIFLINVDPQDNFSDQIFDFAYWQRYIAKSAFTFGPFIASLRNEKHALVTPWEQMEQAWQNMAHHYKFIYEQKVINRRDLEETEAMLQAIYEVYGLYNEAMGDFIFHLDKIRAKPFDELY